MFRTGLLEKDAAQVDAVNWSPVPDDHVRWLECKTPNYDRAVRILSQRPAIELTPEQVREFWNYGASSPSTPDPTTAPSDGSRAFLVRGLAYDPATSLPGLAQRKQRRRLDAFPIVERRRPHRHRLPRPTRVASDRLP